MDLQMPFQTLAPLHTRQYFSQNTGTFPLSAILLPLKQILIIKYDFEFIKYTYSETIKAHNQELLNKIETYNYVHCFSLKHIQ